MDKKYKLMGIQQDFDGHTCSRIYALRDFADVKEGDLGGFVESEPGIYHIP